MDAEYIGKVIFVNQGNYDNSKQYTTLDIVRYNGNSYIAKVDTMGNSPSNGESNNYWQIMTESGNYTPSLDSNGILI